MSTECLRDAKKNTVFIMLDQLCTLEKIPPKIINRLPGFKWLQKNGMRFNNIRNVRQMCSPARATIFTSQINIGIQDNIDQRYQYDTVPQVSNKKDTIAKSLKRNNINVCAYYGKDHFQAQEASSLSNYKFPKININSNGTFRQYGFDINNLYGDSYNFGGKGYFSDNLYVSNLVNHSIENADYTDLDGNRYTGAIPFLKARSVDGQSFHMQLHLMNPHDTQEMWDNLEQVPTNSRMQYWSPFLDEQTTFRGIKNPYVYNENFKDAFATDISLTTNYFDAIFTDYATNNSTLPNLNSYINDYVSDTKINSIDGTMVSFQQMYKSVFTLANNQEDVKSWKNLINNYYGLLILTDQYIQSIIEFLDKRGMLTNTCIMVTSDHGEQLGAHGLKQKYIHYEESQRTDIYVYSSCLDPNFVGKTVNVLGSALDINPTIEMLANIKNPSPEFLGKSLLVKNADGLLIPREQDIDSFNCVQSTMYATSYLFLSGWYNQQPPSKQARVLNNATDYGSYKYMYINSTQKMSNGLLFKITMYYNLNSLLRYNIQNRTQFKDQSGNLLKYTVDQLWDYLSVDEQSKYAQYFKELSEAIFGQSQTLTLLDISKNLKVITKAEQKDTAVTSLIYLIFTKIIQTDLQNIVYFPGALGDLSYEDLASQTDENYFYVHNLTRDPDEITNLADPVNIDESFIPLFNKLTARMMQLVKVYKCLNFYFIPPEIVMKSLLYIFQTKGGQISDNIFFAASLLSNNNYDSSMNVYPNQDKIFLKLNQPSAKSTTSTSTTEGTTN